MVCVRIDVCVHTVTIDDPGTCVCRGKLGRGVVGSRPDVISEHERHDRQRVRHNVHPHSTGFIGTIVACSVKGCICVRIPSYQSPSDSKFDSHAVSDRNWLITALIVRANPFTLQTDIFMLTHRLLHRLEYSVRSCQLVAAPFTDIPLFSAASSWGKLSILRV